MRTSATPHADAFSTRSLSTRLAIAFVPTAAGLLTMPSWCRLCRKALAPSAPPRCARRGRLWGTTPKGSRIKVAGRSHIRCDFDTKRWVERCRFAGCRMPCRRSLPRWSRSVVMGTTVFAAANAQMDTTRYLAAARSAVQMLPQLFFSLCL